MAKTGRPRGDMRKVLNGILYRMRSGVQWNYLPREFGSDTTVHDWFQRFVKDGVFERLWAVLIDACAELQGVKWEWQASTGREQARFGTSPAKTRRTGRNRGRSGCSWSTRTAVASGDYRPGERARQHADRGRDRGGGGRPTEPEDGPPEPLPRQRIRHPERPGGSGEGEVRPAHPVDRRRRTSRATGEGTQAAACGSSSGPSAGSQVPSTFSSGMTRKPRLTLASPTCLCIIVVATLM